MGFYASRVCLGPFALFLEPRHLGWEEAREPHTSCGGSLKSKSSKQLLSPSEVGTVKTLRQLYATFLLSAFALRVKEPSEIHKHIHIYIYIFFFFFFLGNSGNKERKINWDFEEK